MEALHKGDTNHNGKIEVTELAEYVEMRVPELFEELKQSGWVVKGLTAAPVRRGDSGEEDKSKPRISARPARISLSSRVCPNSSPPQNERPLPVPPRRAAKGHDRRFGCRFQVVRSTSRSWRNFCECEKWCSGATTGRKRKSSQQLRLFPAPDTITSEPLSRASQRHHGDAAIGRLVLDVGRSGDGPGKPFEPSVLG